MISEYFQFLKVTGIPITSKRFSVQDNERFVYSSIFFYNKNMQRSDDSSFEEFEATSLYCPRCKTATPVRRKLLLVLPEGEEYEYLCVYCSSSVGTKITKNAPSIDLILKP